MRPPGWEAQFERLLRRWAKELPKKSYTFDIVPDTCGHRCAKKFSFLTRL
jgi:hypothetical protein